jgi:hypothetical protein
MLRIDCQEVKLFHHVLVDYVEFFFLKIGALLLDQAITPGLHKAVREAQIVPKK